MLKRLAILSFTWCAISVPSPAQQAPNSHTEADVRVVSTPPKDRYDKAAFWINATLAGVGIVGIIVGICTLRFLSQQSTEMRRQRIVMRQSLQTMRKQSNVMAGQLQEMQAAREVETKILILQYRPKILVRNATASEFNVLEIGKPAKGRVRFTVVNAGGTLARITGGFVLMLTAEASDVSQIKFLHGDSKKINGSVLHPGQDIQIDEELATGAVNSDEWADYHQGKRTEPLRFLYLNGTIFYEDELDIPRQTSFMRQYDVKKGKFIPGDNRDEEFAD